MLRLIVSAMLVFVGASAAGQNNEAGGLQLVNSGNVTLSPMWDIEQVTWQGDGSDLVIHRRMESELQIYTVDPETGRLFGPSTSVTLVMPDGSIAPEIPDPNVMLEQWLADDKSKREAPERVQAVIDVLLEETAAGAVSVVDSAYQYLLLLAEYEDGEREYHLWSDEAEAFVLTVPGTFVSAEFVYGKLRFVQHASYFAVYDPAKPDDPVVFEHSDPYLSFDPGSRWAVSIAYAPEGEPREGTFYHFETSETFTFDAGVSEAEVVWALMPPRFALFFKDANAISVWELQPLATE
jgi:hypothetical protein